MGHKLGQECNVFYFTSNDLGAVPEHSSFLLLGGVNNKGSTGIVRGSVDTTSGYSKSRLATSQSNDGTIGFFYDPEAAANQKSLRDYILANNQPTGWIKKRYVVAGGAEEDEIVPVLFLSCQSSFTVDEAVTAELVYESMGLTTTAAVTP